MNEESYHPDDERLRSLLRNSRATPLLPPRFQEGVWRRIEESAVPAVPRPNWLDALTSWTLRPRFALSVALMLIAAGSIFGAREGHQVARQNAQSRYLASVAPNSMR